MDQEETITYGSLGDRVKALMVDTIIIAGLGVGAAILLNYFEGAPDYLRGLMFLFVFFLYDPIMTSTAGGTVGHLAMGLRVKRDRDGKRNLLFPLALIRFLVKASLGWISLLTVPGHKQSKALHDAVVQSVMVKV